MIKSQFGQKGCIMSKSSSKPVRIIYSFSPLLDNERYLVFYSSGSIRSFDSLPNYIENFLHEDSCLMWHDGDAIVYDIYEV